MQLQYYISHTIRPPPGLTLINVINEVFSQKVQVAQGCPGFTRNCEMKSAFQKGPDLTSRSPFSHQKSIQRSSESGHVQMCVRFLVLCAFVLANCLLGRVFSAFSDARLIFRSQMPQVLLEKSEENREDLSHDLKRQVYCESNWLLGWMALICSSGATAEQQL